MVEIKVIVVAEAVQMLRERRGESQYAAVLERTDPETRALFQDRLPVLQPMGWFPLDAFVRFLEAHNEVCDEGRESAIVERTEEVVERQLNGVYRSLLKPGRPERVLDRLQAIHATYFRGVSMEKQLERRGEAKIRFVGFEKQHRLIGYSLIGFYRKALQLSGAADVRVEFTTAIEEDQGYADLLVTWS